jgi:hypothetical protein
MMITRLEIRAIEIAIYTGAVDKNGDGIGRAAHPLTLFAPAMLN